MKRIGKWILCFSLFLSMSIFTGTIKAEEANIALGKEVFVSGVEGGKQPDGSLTYPNLNPAYLTDGNAATRWSSDESLLKQNVADAPDQNVWATVDLGKENAIDKVILQWQEACAKNYDIQVSVDNRNWKTVYHFETAETEGQDHKDSITLEKKATARYVRIFARAPMMIGKYKSKSISLYEIEVYPYVTIDPLDAVYEEVIQKAPSLNAQGDTLLLPQSDNPDYKTTLFGSGNQAVIDMQGKVTQPLEDMEVNLFYQVCKGNTKKCRHSDEPKKIVIKGQYTKEESLQPKPNVMPGLREWKGNKGNFVFKNRIVLADKQLQKTAETIQFYIKDMVKKDVAITYGTPKQGDIYLSLRPQLSVGDEGYTLDIDDILTVAAPKEKGILYGGTSITQILYQAKDHASVPKGLVRDYPQYEVRSTMLDVARFYMPLEYLEEVTRYAAFFKLNEIHIHINDSGGETEGSFRVESKKYPKINEGLITYSQADYRNYQKKVKPYGIDVVSEIDTPAHSTALGFVHPELMMDSFHIDLTKPKSEAFVKELYDEFLDGKDPVFQSSKFNIGTDEYNKKYSELVRKYINDMITYINGKGLETRFWASLGTNGFAGTTPVRNDAVAHMWSHIWASFDEMLKDGYRFINNDDNRLYVVPFADYYHDYLNLENLFNSWEVSDLNGGYHLLPGHPQLLGGEAALWNDMKTGASEFDIFDRYRDQVMLMAEKNWYGEKTQGQTGADFLKRVATVDKVAPGSNPARYVESNGDVVAKYDFSKPVNGKVKDESGNSYDADTHNLKATDTEDGSAMLLNAKDYITLPFSSLGYPYTARFQLNISSATPANAIIFEGKDGILYYNYDHSGKLGYERKGYVYVFDYIVPTDTTLQYTLTGDQTNARLYIGNYQIGTGNYYKVSANKQGSTSFVLPTEKIGGGIRGYIKDLTLYNRVLNNEEIMGGENLAYGNQALHKKVEVSGIEGGYNQDGTPVFLQFQPSNAVDNDETTTISLNRVDKAWLMVDLGKEYLIDKVELLFAKRPNSYEIAVSVDKVNWTTIDVQNKSDGGSAGSDQYIAKQIHTARYVKFQQTEMFTYSVGAKYSANIKEFKIFGFEVDNIKKTIEQAKKAQLEVALTDQNKVFKTAFADHIKQLEALLKVGPVHDMIILNAFLEKQTADLRSAHTDIENRDIVKLGTLLKEQLNDRYYDLVLWNCYQQAMNVGKSIYWDLSVKQDRILQAVQQIEQAKEKLEMRPQVNVSASKTPYTDKAGVTYSVDRVFDNDVSTKFWQQSEQAVGDHITFTFRDPMMISTVQLLAKNAGDDILKHGQLLITDDGINWRKVADIGGKEDETINLGKAKAKTGILGLKIEVTKANPTWWILNEVVLNGKPYIDKSVLKDEIDRPIEAAGYTPQSYEAYTNVKTQVVDVYENVSTTQKDVDKAIEDIRNARYGLVAIINTTRLQKLLGIMEDKTLYTDASYVLYQTAYDAGKALLNNEAATQAEVNLAAWNIEEAKSGLVRKAVNKKALLDKLKEAKGILNSGKPDQVHATIKKIFMDAYQQAQAVEKDEKATQPQIDTALDALSKAVAMMQATDDKQQLIALVDMYQDIPLAMYENGLVKDTFTKAYAQAKAILDNPLDLDGHKIKKALNELLKAYTDLQSVRIHTEDLEALYTDIMKQNMNVFVQNDAKTKLEEMLKEAAQTLLNPINQAHVQDVWQRLRTAYANVSYQPSVEQLAGWKAFMVEYHAMNRKAYKEETLAKVDETAALVEKALRNPLITNADAQTLQKKIDEAHALMAKPDKTGNQVDVQTADVTNTAIILFTFFVSGIVLFICMKYRKQS